MKDEQLLSAMFDDAAEFREQLLGETLRRVRRKRRIRSIGRALLALVIAAFTIWWGLPHRATFNSAPVQVGRGVPAEPQAAARIVLTSPLSAGQLVTTRQDSVVMISSDKSTVAMLDDDRLLDLVPGETKLLVWHAPHEAELVIVGP